MNPDTSTQSWINVAFAALLSIIGWFVNRYIAKLEAIERQQSTCITRDELKGYLSDIKADRVRMHEENLDNLREIRNDLKDLRNQ